MTSIEFICKFCKHHGVAQYDERCPALNLEAWAKSLCCNRCGDYHARRLVLEAAIKKAVERLVVTRQTCSDRKGEIIQAIRQVFTELTKSYARLVCEFSCLQFVWEQEFVDLLMEKPDRWYFIIANYRKQISAIQQMPMAITQPELVDAGSD